MVEYTEMLIFTLTFNLASVHRRIRMKLGENCYYRVYYSVQMVIIAFSYMTIQTSRTLSNEPYPMVLYENTTEFLEVNNFVSLSENKHFKLNRVNATTSPNIAIKYIEMYQEFSTLEIRSETLVDSFGFRLGGISSHPMQLILTRDRILVYNFTARDPSSPMNLYLVSNSSLADILPERNVTFMEIEGTTSAIQSSLSIIEFVILVRSTYGNCMLIPLQFECKDGAAPQACKPKKRKELDLSKLNFINMQNQSDTIPCNGALASLDNLYNSSENNERKEGITYLYFARFCKLSSLSLEQQILYSNTVEVYMLTSNMLVANPIQLKTTIHEISYSNTTYKTQVVDLIEFRGAVLLFNSNETYQIQPSQLNKTSLASNAFTNNGMMTNLVACQQNDYSVVSCYLSLYDPGTQEHNNYLTEFANVQDNVIRIPPIALSYVTSGEVLGAINLNFIVFIDNQLFEADNEAADQNSLCRMKIIQRGTEDILTNVTSNSNILLMKPMGPNFMMFRNTDIGMIFKQNPSIQGFNASVYTMQLPLFRLDMGSANKSLPCFSYTTDCQVVQLNLTYQPITALAHNSLILNFYHLNQNFSSVIPVDLNNSMMEVDITRDQVSINVTDSFHGVPHLLQITNREFSPVSGISNYNATTFFTTFDDLRINITGIDQLLYDYSSKDISSAIPSVVRYSDGSIFVSVGYILDVNQYSRLVVICQLPESVDAGSDSEFTFSYNSLVCATPDFAFSRADISLTAIVNSEIRGGVYYLLAYEGGNDVFRYLQIYVSDNEPPRCLVHFLDGISQILLQNVRVIRSSSTTFDDCLVYWNDEEFNIVSVDYSTSPKFGTNITGEKLISINLKKDYNSWEWVFPNIQDIQAVTIADFNVVYISYRYSAPIGSAMQIHQCDFYSKTPKCYLYSWIQLDAEVTERVNPIIIDPKTFNFIRLSNRLDMEFSFFDMAGFQNDFMFRTRKELKPSKLISLSNILKTSFVEYFPIEDGAFVMNSVAGFLAISVDGKSSGCNLVIINLAVPNLLTRIDSSPGLCSTDEFSSPTELFNQAGSEPYNFPLLSRLRPEQHFLISVNPSSGIILNNLKQLNSNYSEMYMTEGYQLVIQSVPGTQFIQDFFGATKYNFNFFVSSNPVVKNKPKVSVGSIMKGFIQNLSIACDCNQEGSSIIFRNSTVGLVCSGPSSDMNLTFILDPFIHKDMDAILNNYDDHDLGSIVDYFVLSVDNTFMIVLHDYISVMRLQTTLQFAANIYLKGPNGEVVAINQCITINEGPIQEDILEVEIICFNGLYLLYTFTLNITELENIVSNPQSNPAIQFLDAQQYELSGYVASLYTSKSSQVMYLADLYFSLNTIMIENYNDRGYLNIYNGAKTGGIIQPTLLWSSLSLDQFANCDLLIYKVTRLAKLIGADQLCLFTIMACDGGNLYTSFTNITTGEVPAFDTGASQPFTAQYPVSKVQLYWRNTTLFMFLLNQDLIQEYVSNDLFSFRANYFYRLSSVCEISSSISIFREGNYMFLYCYNSTSDSTMNDNLLVYNTQANIQSNDDMNFIDPMQQISFPDVDSPSNMMITTYSPPNDPDSVKLAISTTRSFISQYSFKSDALLYWQEFSRYKQDGYYDLDFNVVLSTQNILSTANPVIPFVIPLMSVILNYLNWFYMNIAACVVVALYVLVTNILIYKGIRMQKRSEENNQTEAKFIHEYKMIMDNQSIKAFMIDGNITSPITTNTNSLAFGHFSIGLTLANAGTEPRQTREHMFGYGTANY